MYVLKKVMKGLMIVLIVFISFTIISSADCSSSNGEDSIKVWRMSEFENNYFRHRDPWLGGDAVFSVNTSEFHENTIMFTYGDTLWGEITENTKNVESMTNNSVSFYNYVNKSIEFHITGSNSSPRNIFEVPEWIEGEADGVWPLSPFIQNGEIYWFPYAVDYGENGQGFERVDVYLAGVDNPGSAPENWNINNYRMKEIPLFTMRDVYYCADKDLWYLYGDPGPDENGMIIARTQENIKNFDAWEFYDGENWNSSFQIVTEPSLGNYSVDYMPAIDKYIITDTSLESINFRLGDTPVGPWSEPIFLYTPPELDQIDQSWVYAAKLHIHHPHFPEDENKIILSYVINSFKKGATVTNPKVYVPYFLEIDFSEFDENELLEPDISVENLTIQPEIVNPGDPVSVSVEVMNAGRVKGSQTIELSVDNLILDNREITLSPMKSRTITFTISREEIGTHEIKIGESTETLEVRKSEKPGDELPKIPLLIIVIIIITTTTIWIWKK